MDYTCWTFLVFEHLNWLTPKFCGTRLLKAIAILKQVRECTNPPYRSLRTHTWFVLMNRLYESVSTQCTTCVTRLSRKGYTVFYACLTLLFGWLLFSYADYRLHEARQYDLRYSKRDQPDFSSFEGFSECGFRAAELYVPPIKDQYGLFRPGTFCRDRKHLLKAMSEGGRIGFDAPYQSQGKKKRSLIGDWLTCTACAHRWFAVEEMCFILERFDAVVFIGDESLETIYGGFNAILRRDLVLGALDLEFADQASQTDCRCDNQYVKQSCRSRFLLDSKKASREDHIGATYFCNRAPHVLLKLQPGKPEPLTIEKFRDLVPRAPRSSYRPIPIIHSLSPATVSTNDAAVSLLKFMDLADDSGRKTPMLWIGPTAAGHIELKDRKGNQEIWDFDRKMATTANENDIDVLGMWNLTVQATSWDGMRFGSKVAVTQAMMVINWLSRLESSWRWSYRIVL